MKKIANILAILATTIPLTANAECVPVPDCASIGYTETSCDGDSLKCPFDTTKLKCISCDSSFRYSCLGNNIKNPIGTACNNKYVACECEDRTIFVNGECVCDTSCDTIGNIYYSDGTCSSCNIANKTPIGIIVNRGIITQLHFQLISWSSQNSDVSTIENGIGIMDMKGKENTQKIIEFFPNDNETNNAAWYCHNLVISDFQNRKGQWYLPAAGEVYNYFYQNFTIINKTLSLLNLSSFSQVFWTSSEMRNIYAHAVRANTGSLSGSPRYETYIANCLLEI